MDMGDGIGLFRTGQAVLLWAWIEGWEGVLLQETFVLN
jgi:hypothetical protein